MYYSRINTYFARVKLTIFEKYFAMSLFFMIGFLEGQKQENLHMTWRELNFFTGIISKITNLARGKIDINPKLIQQKKICCLVPLINL